MNIIDKFKNIFLAETKTFADAKDLEGNILRVEGDDFEVGQVLSLVDEAGVIHPTPSAIYGIGDGRTIITDEDSIIIEIVAAEEKAEEDEAPTEEVEMAETAEAVTEDVVEDTTTDVTEEITEEVTEDATDLNNKVSEIEEVIEMIMDKLKELEAKNSDLETEKDELVTEMSAIKEENKALKDTTPSTKAVEFKKIDVTKVDNKEAVNRGKFSQFIADKRNKK